LSIDLGPERPRWTLSRLVQRSAHRERILERVEFVRRFFPELDGVTVRLGLAQKPGVLGWGSLDPDQPGIWVRPRRLDYFTIAHEFTHLLQARRLVPGGERSCDLYALARTPLIVDAPPGYLQIPSGLRVRRRLTQAQSAYLCDVARRALAAREAGDRRYLMRFEQEIAEAWRAGTLAGAARVRPVQAAVDTLRLGFEFVRARIRAAAEAL
jgi:DNA-binding XRE family transcriptional regulator